MDASFMNVPSIICQIICQSTSDFLTNIVQGRK